jgi:hypothetical protein
MSSNAIKRAAPANPANAAVATAQVFSLASNPLLACTLAVPGKLALESKRFFVRAEGNAQVAAGTTTGNITLLGALALPTAPLTAANWTVIKAGTAAAIATLGCPWWMQADLIFDSTSGLVHGTFGQLMANTITATAAVSGVLTGVNGTNLPQVQAGPVTIQPADPVFYLALAATFTVGAGSVANLSNFEIGF